MLTKKDENLLINKPNEILAGYCARVMFTDMPEEICSFFEQNSDRINGRVVVVRSKKDESVAAHARNTCDKVLFIFSEDYWLTSYFSGVCEKIHLPTALIKRALH